MSDLNHLTATEAARRVAAGEITSEALVHACLERIAAREGAVGAWAWIDPGKALAAARAKDASEVSGPLHGVPVAIKDIMPTFDMPTAYGSPIYATNQESADSACVALLRRAGAIVLGKTVTTEFAAATPGKTANPHNIAHSPGGSSSGSAAAVADFMVPLGLGTQTVGSTIRPAAYCGAVGFKPTYQALPFAGIKAQAETLDTLGLIARSVDDTALLSGVLAGAPEAFAAPARTIPPRLAFCRTPHWPQAHPSTVKVMDEAIAMLREAGATIEEADLPETFAPALDAHWTIVCFEMARALAHEARAHRDGLSPRLAGLLDKGMAIPHAEYKAAIETARRSRTEAAPLLARYDALLTPSASGEAPEGLDSVNDLLFQRLWTVLHTPALTLPGFTGDKGLPVGIQLVGAWGTDAELLSVARWVEKRIAER